MILQELIRNIVVYKGVIKPVLLLWKESLLVRYNSLAQSGFYKKGASEFTKTKMVAPNMSILKIISLSNITGTRTIPLQRKITKDNFSLLLSKRIFKSALTGSSVSSVLIDTRMDEDIAATSKTIFQSQIARLSFLPQVSKQKSISTTGFTIETTYYFSFRKTHEERELLGGFSLTHERNQLMSTLERR